MSSFSLRVDVFGWNCLDQLDKFLQRFDSYFVVEEQANNLHYHVWFSSDETIKAVRARFTRLFPDHNGNKGMYSLVQCDQNYQRYLQYMCKGKEFNDGPVIKLRQGYLFTDDWVYDTHCAYWLENGTIEESKALRQGAKLKGNMVEQVEAECKRLGITHDRVEIAKVYIRLMTAMKKPISVYAAKSVVNTVQVVLDNDYGLDKLAAECSGY